MNTRKGLRLISLLLICVLMVGMQPIRAQAAEEAGRFILVVESGGQLVIVPEYISYTEGQTIGEALIADFGVRMFDLTK